MNEIVFRNLIEDMGRFPQALLGIFHGSDDAFLRTRPAEGKWSPLEILAHLRDIEVEDMRSRARAVVEGTEIELGVDPDGWARDRRYNEMDPGAVFLDFAKERADSCIWLEGLGMEDLERSKEHPATGVMKAADFIAAWRMHDFLHLRQLATTMAVLTAKRLHPLRVDYAGPVPDYGKDA